jgi:hypothetical protein
MAIPQMGLFVVGRCKSRSSNGQGTGFRNRIRCVDSENKSFLLQTNQDRSLPLNAVELNHVQSTSHAPPATASVNQGIDSVSWETTNYELRTTNLDAGLYVLTLDRSCHISNTLATH